MTNIHEMLRRVHKEMQSGVCMAVSHTQLLPILLLRYPLATNIADSAISYEDKITIRELYNMYYYVLPTYKQEEAKRSPHRPYINRPIYPYVSNSTHKQMFDTLEFAMRHRPEMFNVIDEEFIGVIKKRFENYPDSKLSDSKAKVLEVMYMTHANI